MPPPGFGDVRPLTAISVLSSLAVQARVLLFLVALVHGLISSVASLEESIPIALGLPVIQASRRGLGTTSKVPHVTASVFSPDLLRHGLLRSLDYPASERRFPPHCNEIVSSELCHS